MKMIRFDAVAEKDGKPYRLSLDSISIAAVEESTDTKHCKTCFLRGRKGETYLVKGDFATISERVSPKQTRWSEFKVFLNTKLGALLLTAGLSLAAVLC